MRDAFDVISGFCVQGKHGRCTGWMVVPSYGDLHEHPDISVRCLCPPCKHPPVAPDHHLTHPTAKRSTAWNTKASTETPSSPT